jgi:hypothetical protein
MEKYNPSKPPNPEQWLALDESSRIGLVREYVDAYETDAVTEEEAKNLHAVIHVIIENQLAENVDPVPDTLKRLIKQGLTRHNAIHAIGSILAEELFDVMQGSTELPTPLYNARLEKLTAKRWKKGKW